VINSVVLVGRLGNDPELSYSQSGVAICKFRIAVDRPPRSGGDSSRGGETTERSEPIPTSEKCPNCADGMLRIREGRRGKFLGCTNYPNCTYSRDYEGDGSEPAGGGQQASPAPQQQETDWLNIVALGRTAEISAQYLSKGALVGIEGRIQSRSWDTPEGTRAYMVEILANRVQFLESRRDREAREASHGGPRPQQQGGYRQGGPQGGGYQQQGPPPQQAPQGAQQGGPEIDWTMDESEDPFGDQ